MTHEMNAPTRLLEAPSAGVDGKIRDALAPDEDILICVSTDLDVNGLFDVKWLVVTSRRALIVPEGGVDGVVEVPIDGIKSVQTEPLVGGGELEIERPAAPTIRLPYSSTMADKLSEAARGLEQLRKGEHLFINPHLERIRCLKCGRLLPERDGVCLACVKQWATLRRIAGYISPYKGKAVVLAVASLITTSANLVPPLITKELVDEVLVPLGDDAGSMDERAALLGVLVMALIAMRLVSWGAEWVHGWVVCWLGARATADVRSELYRRLEMLSLQFYDKRKVGALMSRVTRDSGRLQDFLVDGLPYIVINVLMMVGILVFLLSMNWQLTLLTLLPVPPLIIWGGIFWRRMWKLFRRWSNAWGLLTNRTAEALSGIRVVKAFAQENREIDAFQKENRKCSVIGVETNVNRTVFFATVTFLKQPWRHHRLVFRGAECSRRRAEPRHPTGILLLHVDGLRAAGMVRPGQRLDDPRLCRGGARLRGDRYDSRGL